MNKFSQHEKILITILRNRDMNWWRASDFMKMCRGDLFVGYSASARMSEMIKFYDFAFSARTNGKFREIRFKFEEANEIYKLLPDDLKRHLVIEKIIV